jgi:hypothetical protein
MVQAIARSFVSVKPFPEHHPYELLTAMEGIEHLNTKIRSYLIFQLYQSNI